MDQEIYIEIVKDTIVPSNITDNEKSEKYNRIVKYINQNMPKRLYRFRTASEQNISAFYKDEIWFSSANRMNDDFEARIYYNMEKIQSDLMNLLHESGNLNLISILQKMDEVFLKMPQFMPNERDGMPWKKQLPIEQIIVQAKECIKSITANLDEQLKFTENILRESTRFACFSENIYSDMMWGHYANNAQGFALEYVIDRCSNVFTEFGTSGQYKVNTSLFPIIYDNRRLDGTLYVLYLIQRLILQYLYGPSLSPQLLNALVPCPDEFMATKIALRKSYEWKSEKEWRVFYQPDFSEDSRKNNVIHIKPKAVYLGRKISDINQKILMDIAEEKGIAVYKMYINASSNEYKLASNKIEIK